MSATDRLTICCSHADPGAVAGSTPFATGSERMHDAWDVVCRIVADFGPDLVVFFGTDHRRGFRGVIPTAAIALEASACGDRGGPTGSYRVPTELARQLVAGLVDREIDVAVAYRPSLDHAFGLTARDLLGGLDGYRIIPVVLNSASPPVPSFRRAATIGRAVGEVFADRLERILYLGSGGLTHDLPGFYPLDDGIDWSEEERLARNARLNPELRIAGLRFTPQWDEELLAGLSARGDRWLSSVGRDVAARGGNGANEALTWVAAWAAGAEPLVTLAYEFDDEHDTSTAVMASASAVAAVTRVGG